MKIADINRLRGDAPPTTHLARYDRAVDRKAKRVLNVVCPDCGAGLYMPCVPVFS